MKRLLVCVAALLGFAFAAGAQAAGIVVPAEQRYSAYSGSVPECDDAGVLGQITGGFGWKEYWFWNSSAQVSGFDRIRELGLRANGLGYIPRRYCAARAEIAGVGERVVVYQIAEALGPIGWGYGVEWCVVSFDRNLAYAPGCSALRPFVQRKLVYDVLRARY